MMNRNNINVFWWSSIKFENKQQENFGDILSKYLVEKISNKNVIWRHPIKMKWNPFIKAKDMSLVPRYSNGNVGLYFSKTF